MRHVTLFVLLVGTVGSAQEPATVPWKLTDAQVRARVGRVRAGRDLTPKSWPNGAGSGWVVVRSRQRNRSAARRLRKSLAVCAGRVWLAHGIAADLGAARATQDPRIVLRAGRERIAASRFGPGHRAERAARDRIARLDSRTQLAARRDHRARPHDALCATLEKLSGRRPVGMRTPSWDYSKNTLKIAKEMGLLYDSSLMADDRPYEMLADGQPAGVVQLPVEWMLDDAPYFWNDRSTGVRPTMNPDEVLAIWKAEFDVAYEERTMFILTMHLEIIGHRASRDARPIDRAHEIQSRRRLVRDARADRALREGAEVMETIRFRSSGERHQRCLFP